MAAQRIRAANSSGLPRCKSEGTLIDLSEGFSETSFNDVKGKNLANPWLKGHWDIDGSLTLKRLGCSGSQFCIRPSNPYHALSSSLKHGVCREKVVCTQMHLLLCGQGCKQVGCTWTQVHLEPHVTHMPSPTLVFETGHLTEPGTYQVQQASWLA